jgi:hypothetical protein
MAPSSCASFDMTVKMVVPAAGSLLIMLRPVLIDVLQYSDAGSVNHWS